MNVLRNSVRLIGHLGDNPKIRKLDSEKSVANLSVATNEDYRDHDGNKKSETTWHKLAPELLRLLHREGNSFPWNIYFKYLYFDMLMQFNHFGWITYKTVG